MLELAAETLEAAELAADSAAEMAEEAEDWIAPATSEVTLWVSVMVAVSTATPALAHCTSKKVCQLHINDGLDIDILTKLTP